MDDKVLVRGLQSFSGRLGKFLQPLVLGSYDSSGPNSGPYRFISLVPATNPTLELGSNRDYNVSDSAV